MFVNIIACGRNGSTLLTRLLDGHQNLVLYPNEVNLFRISKNKRNSKNFFKEFFNKELLILDQTCKENLQKKKLRDFKKKTSWNKNLNFLQNLFNNYIYHYDKFYKKKIKNILIFKSTDVENIEKYQKNFPTMKFIHLVRDPLTNYESIKRSRLQFKSKTIFQEQKSLLENFIENRWRKHLDFYFKINSLNQENHLLIKYEDLCDKTNFTLNKILKFLNSNNKKINNTQSIFNGQSFRNLPNSSSERKIPTNFKAVNLRKKYKYNNILDKSEIYLINLTLGKLMKKLNYPKLKFHIDKFNILRPKSWEFSNFLNIKQKEDLLINLLFPFLYIKYKIYKLGLLIKN